MSSDAAERGTTLFYEPSRDVLSHTRVDGLLTLYVPETAEYRRRGNIALFVCMTGMYGLLAAVNTVIFDASARRELIGTAVALSAQAVVGLCFAWAPRGFIRLEWNGRALVVVRGTRKAERRRQAWGRDEISGIAVVPWMRRFGVIAVRLIDGRRHTIHTGHPLPASRDAVGMLRGEMGLPDEQQVN